MAKSVMASQFRQIPLTNAVRVPVQVLQLVAGASASQLTAHPG
ncbi:hypothetical protein [Spirosoma luteum]|nr:hypothetical protein [Spirosoma luteum]